MVGSADSGDGSQIKKKNQKEAFLWDNCVQKEVRFCYLVLVSQPLAPNSLQRQKLGFPSEKEIHRNRASSAFLSRDWL